MTISWPFSRQQVLDDSGRPLLTPRVNFYRSGTTTPLTVYKDASRSTPWSQPVVADAFGRFPRVYLPEGLYREEVLGPTGSLLWNDDGLGVPVAEVGADTPVDPTALASTGDIKWRLDATIQAGWVRMNARTIGGSGSGATELANASARDLFLYLWRTFPDSVAPVVGGRGASATEDFSSGRQITIPSMQGLVAAGLDDMGSSPAGRLQTIVNLTLASGSTAAIVSDASVLSRGMLVMAQGVSAGTTVADVTGTTITLSQPAASGSTGTVVGRFSYVGDAQAPAGVGGTAVVGLALDQLPSFTPSGTLEEAGLHKHDLKYMRMEKYVTNASGGGVDTINETGRSNITTTTESAGSHTHPFRGDPLGSDQVHSNLQPTRLGTYYLKL